MLNKLKLVKLFDQDLPNIIFTKEKQANLAVKIFKYLLENYSNKDTLSRTLKLYKNSQWLLPELLEDLKFYAILNNKVLDNKILENNFISQENKSRSLEYKIISTDGSQIYPDKHEGFNFGLINIGVISIEYKKESSVTFTNFPSIITNPIIGESITPDLINCQRSQYEFEYGFNFALGLPKDPEDSKLQESLITNNTSKTVEDLRVEANACKRPIDLNQLETLELLVPNKPNADLTLFDGSLIFWHLESKDKILKDYFLERYLISLDNFYRSKLTYASYISMPVSKDLVNIARHAQELIKLNLLNLNLEINSFIDLDTITDGDILENILPIGYRTNIFKHTSNIADYYPKHNVPCFIYLNVGLEIIRLEFPYWIAQDLERVNIICSLVLDQCKKGNGYPVVLAEAHEQAVIKSQDRNFFYQALRHFFQNKRIFSKNSAKLAKKLSPRI